MSSPGTILSTGKHMLVNTDVTHNTTDILPATIWPLAL
jgi:hypothetical protein